MHVLLTFLLFKICYSTHCASKSKNFRRDCCKINGRNALAVYYMKIRVPKLLTMAEITSMQGQYDDDEPGHSTIDIKTHSQVAHFMPF